MAQLADLTAPEVGAPAGFHDHNAGQQLTEKRENLVPSQLLAQNWSPRDVSAMRLKHVLRKVEPDRGNLEYERPPLWAIADPAWHIDAIGGRSHHQSHMAGKVAEPAKSKSTLARSAPARPAYTAAP
jgi:hypothetical protein